jgi:hypothetical protein
LLRDIATVNLCFQAFKDLWELASMQNIDPATVKPGDDQRKLRKRVDKKLTSLLKKL